jgi:predicted RNA-binding Zn ribbon-like protein
VKPIAELPFVGGHVALDFVNTAEGRGGPGAGDALGGAADLAVWGQRYGLLDTRGDVGAGAGPAAEPAGAKAAEGELARATDARELLYSLFLDRVRGEPSPPDTLSRLARLAAESYRAGHLRADGDANVRWAWPSGDLATVRHAVVTSALDLLRDVPAGRLRQCPGDNCGWFFLDTTKRGNRRWCSMSECGQDAKDERRRALRRASTSVGSVA